MTNRHRKTALQIALGLGAVLAVLAMRGMAPELIRYLRIRRM